MQRSGNKGHHWPGRRLALALINFPIVALFATLPLWQFSSPWLWPCLVPVSACLGAALAGNILLRREQSLHNASNPNPSADASPAAEQAILHAILEGTADAVFLCDQAGRVRLLNHTATILFDFHPPEVLGEPLSRLIAQSAGTSPEPFFAPDGVAGPPCEIRGLRRNGSVFPATLTVTSVASTNGTVYVAVVRDLTPIQEARQLADVARQAKTNFLINISHELRTPLHAILGLAELLRPTLSAAQSAHLDQLSHSAESLLALIEQLLDFAQLEAGEVTLTRAEFSLRQVVRDAMASHLTEATRRGLALTLDVSSSLGDFYHGDPFRIGQIVRHLVANAVKFTEHGHVSVRIFEEPGAKRSLLAPASVVLEVTDTGVGIPQHLLSQVFAAFEQADATSTRRFGGVGLGLSIVSELAKRMGGQVAVENREFGGTAFRVCLPLTVAGESLVPPTHDVISLEAVPYAQVLLVVPNSIRRHEVSEALLQVGWLVCPVCTGRDALLELYRNVIQGRPYPLLIISDRLPDLSVDEVVLQHTKIAPEGFSLLLSDTDPAFPPPVGIDAVLPSGCDPGELCALLGLPERPRPRCLRAR